ncbi:MAG: magnesium chelatase, partial [Actinomycetota bacterium]
IRLPLDVLLVASANPEDYTNRGRIITPLKDRFGSQIRTHYPLDVATEVQIVRQEARPATIGDVQVRFPAFMEDIVAEITHLARGNANVSQRSGVSVRLSVSNHELLAANAMRRGLLAKESVVAPRVCDLDALVASTAGKIEIERVDEGRDGAVFEQIVRGAVLQVYKRRVSGDKTRDVLAAFEAGATASTGEDVSSGELVKFATEVPALRTLALALVDGDESPAAVASAVEFVLEGLHLAKRLNKDASGGRAVYRSRSTSV